VLICHLSKKRLAASRFVSVRLCTAQCNKDITSHARNIAAVENLVKSVFLLHIIEMKSLKKLVDHLFAMENTTTDMTVVLTLAFGLVLGSIGFASLVHAQTQTNTTAGGGNMTGSSTGPGAAIPGNVTNPTNATNSPSAVGGGNMTSPSTATAANQTASMQSGGNK
jgi:hypothetical protein